MFKLPIRKCLVLDDLIDRLIGEYITLKWLLFGFQMLFSCSALTINFIRSMRPTGSKYNEENVSFLNNNTGKSYCLVDIRDKILLYFAIKCYCTYFFHLVKIEFDFETNVFKIIDIR